MSFDIIEIETKIFLKYFITSISNIFFILHYGIRFFFCNLKIYQISNKLGSWFLYMLITSTKYVVKIKTYTIFTGLNEISLLLTIYVYKLFAQDNLEILEFSIRASIFKK